jgi:pimeloyl-ACP methyl ester carboxylesterase
VARLAAAVLAVKPLVEGVAAPMRVVPVAGEAPAGTRDPSRGQWRALQALFARTTARAGVTGLVLTSEDRFGDPHVFERVVSERLALGELLDSSSVVPVDRLDEADRIVAETVAGSFDSFARRDTVSSVDGVPLDVWAAGAGPETVVLVPACGMPAVLAERWVRFFAGRRRVLTWGSRGLFGAAAGTAEEYPMDIGAQASDLFTVMDQHGVEKAHVVGLCGGAAIALVAAAERPSRISSLSLWHGAYGFGEDYPKTSHQRGLIELMKVAARGKGGARAVHAAFCRAVLTSAPADVAHLVLYPYASPELLFRYCRLNLGITETDIEPYLPGVPQPVLVMTSHDDDIAHPEGSQRVAAGLPRGQLRIEPHGDHISLFAGQDSLLRVAEDFLTRHPAPR